MKFSALLAALPALAIASPSPQTLGIQPPSSLPPSVKLSDLKADGSGCPPDTLKLSLHGSQVRLSFADFFASTATSNPSDRRRFCQVNFKVKYPPGWSLSVSTSEVQGYTAVSSGVRAEIVNSFYFGGVSQGANDPTAKYTVQGPNYSHAFDHISTVSTNVWSPCGEEVIINMKTDIRLIGKGMGVIGVEKQSNNFVNSVNLKWKEC